MIAFIFVLIFMGVICYIAWSRIKNAYKQSSNSGDSTNDNLNQTDDVNNIISNSKYDQNVNVGYDEDSDDAIKSYSRNFLDNLFNVHKSDLDDDNNDATEGITNYSNRKAYDYQVTSKNNKSYWESKKLNKKDQWADKNVKKKKKLNIDPNAQVFLFFIITFFALPFIVMIFQIIGLIIQGIVSLFLV